ncbi:MAG: hypothetical protein Q8O67_06055 [Deltaproteobacteria bacterium]|nr:hypothetical protein [Deltaproteobacteria bacterium]
MNVSHRHDRPRGYALIIVLGISMILAIGVGTMLSYLAAAEKTSGRQRLNREAYYVCDGLGRVITRATVDVLGDSSKFSEGANLDEVLRTEVETHLGNDLVDVLPPGYTLENDSDSFAYRDVDADESFGTVGLGRFSGLTGQRRTFTYDLALKKLGASTCKTTATVDTMRIPFGELAMFSDENLRICPSWDQKDVTREARYHINGDLNVGNITLPRTTMTGELTTACSDGGSDSVVRFCFREICVNSGSGEGAFKNIGGLTTQLFSDRARGTSALTLSVTGRKAQHGVRIDNNTLTSAETSNTDNFRFLVDPGFTGDTPSVKAMKLAHAAVIRIIDGVWYINDGSWPGAPIWSDHAGNYKIPTGTDEFSIIADDLEVGRDDLYSTKPKRYSAVDSSGDVKDGVISYGLLKRNGASLPLPTWAPDAGGADQHLKAIAAAHTGFVDMHSRRDAQDRGHLDTGNILPINFDMTAFINAVLDETGNELGAKLTAFDHPGERDLLVWIGGTWPESLKGLTDTSARPKRAPSLAVAVPAPAVDPLPYPMCKTGETDAFDCAKARRPNAVRVFNASPALPSGMRITIASSLPLYVLGSVDREPAAGVRPSPVIPRSHFDAGSDLSFNLDDGPDVFFAADSATLLSDEWTDSDRPWALDLPDAAKVATIERGSGTAPIPAYNASFLIGRTINGSPTIKAPYGLERSLRFLEHWGASKDSPLVTGSLLIGFRSVYTVAPVCYAPATVDPKCTTDSAWRHFWSAKLSTTGGQPPGMPAFSLRAQGETLPDSQQFDLAAFFAMIFASFPFSLGFP